MECDGHAGRRIAACWFVVPLEHKVQDFGEFPQEDRIGLRRDGTWRDHRSPYPASELTSPQAWALRQGAKPDGGDLSHALTFRMPVFGRRERVTGLRSRAPACHARACITPRV